jgi:hypothetical protein
MTDFKELIRKEYQKCASNPIYFMKKYCYIQHPIRGRLLFGLYPYQEDALNTFQQEKYTIVLKGRQIGLSTVVACYALWMMLFYKDKNVLVIATKQDTAKNLINKVRFAFENLPPWLQVACIEKNKLSLRFNNGSQIKAASSAGDSARSEALSLLVLDEAAFIKNAEEIWTAAQATLSTGGKAVLISCVTEDTTVFTDKGIQEISELVNTAHCSDYNVEPYFVSGVGGQRKGFLMHNNGVSETKKLITKSSNIEGTLKHKVLSLVDNKFGWNELSNIGIDNWIAVQSGMESWGTFETIPYVAVTSNKIKRPFTKTKIDVDLAYVMGLYIAEGSVYKKYNNNKFIGGSMTLTCGDNISTALQNANLSYSTYDNLHYIISSKQFIEALESIGFDLSRKANVKEIPKNLMQMNRMNMISMLQGLFDGDGCATKRGTISYTSTSYKLTHQIRMILLNLGIKSSYVLHTKDKMNLYNNKNVHNYDTHILEITGVHAVKFFDTVGFKFDRKQIRKQFTKSSNRNSSHDVIPNSLDLVLELCRASRKSISTLNTEHNLFLNGICNTKTPYKTKHISSNTVWTLYDNYAHLLNSDVRIQWRWALLPDVSWEQVKHVSYGSKQTYDFSLIDDPSDMWSHSVVYNGIVGHQTPNGIGNFFYEKYIEAEEYAGRDTSEDERKVMTPIKLDWKVHPERDQKWRDEQGSLLGEQKARQEYDAEFLGSGNTVIDGDLIEFHRKANVRKPDLISGPGGDLWIWEQPNYTKTYLVVADVARGEDSENGDYSACHVLDAESCAQVAEYRGRIPTTEYGHLLIGLATQYNDALLVVENGNIGWATIQTILNRGYKNLFYMTEDLKYLDAADIPSNKINRMERNAVAGFTTSTRTRPLIISKLDEYMRTNEVIIRSERTINELLTFVWENGKAQASSPKFHDDLIMSLAIGLWVRDTALQIHQKNTEYTRLSLDKMTKVSNFDGIYTGGKKQLNANHVWSRHTHTSNEAQPPIQPIGGDPYQTPLGDGTLHDLRWLL